MKTKRQTLIERFGTIPSETGLKRRTRIHQGWWRMNVLNEKPGVHPKDKEKNVCNTIFEGKISKRNFLTQNSIKAVDTTVAERKKADAGIMELDRLYNNLLSSQPLCFNFFGELWADTDFGLKVLQNWWPELTELKRVIFEYAPEERYTDDNSAFDVAFEVAAGNKTGLVGLECKYTDTFSSTVYDKPAYQRIYKNANSFAATYEDLKASKFNQLFRNQLIAEALLQNGKFNFVKTGLYCYHEDRSAITTAKEFQKMLVNSDSFTTITYRDFISATQKLDLDWEKREWTMLLWARYCGKTLSEGVNEILKEK
jgi:hypothetical protein